MARRVIHPFIVALNAHDGPMEPVLHHFAHSNDPVLTTLGRLQRARLQHTNADEALREAAALDLTKADPGLTVLLFSTWFMLAAHLNRLAEAFALVRRAEALAAQAPIEIKAWAALAQIELYLATGAWGQAEKMARELAALVPAESPLRRRAVRSLCKTFCTQARGAQVKAELNWLRERIQPEFPIDAFLLAADSTERGCPDQAAPFVAQCLASQTVRGICGASLMFYDAVLQIQQGRWRMGPAPDEAKPSDDQDAPHAAAWSTYALSCRQPEVALRWARAATRGNVDLLNEQSFDAFTLVRAELACRNASAASHILQLRRQRGTMHFLDDFFQARLATLRGEPQAAAAQFTQALQAARRYDAEGRLNFELSLACEVNPLTIVQWGADAAQKPVAKERIALRPSSPSPVAQQGVAGLLGPSRALQSVRENVLKYAPLSVPVLITGETGVGKEVVARSLHDASPRKQHPFIAINCGAISESLLEADLFGHARGAFTGAEQQRAGVFEEAGMGTLFLDEIGEISPRLQAALLRVLENNEIRLVGKSTPRKIHCRIVFATNVELEEAVRDGRFRQDLLYRLRRLELVLPPLRARRDDILPLALHFLNQDRAGPAAFLAADAVDAFQRYTWPGNVRELRNEIERLRLMNSDQCEYCLKDVPEQFRARLLGASQIGTASAANLSAAPEAKESVEDVTLLLRNGRSAIRRIGRLKDLFKAHRLLTRSEVARIMDIALGTAARDLKQLCAEEYITKVQPTPAPVTHYYVLKDTTPE